MEMGHAIACGLSSLKELSFLGESALHCSSLEEDELPHVLSGGMMSSTSVETAGRSSGE